MLIFIMRNLLFIPPIDNQYVSIINKDKYVAIFLGHGL